LCLNCKAGVPPGNITASFTASAPTVSIGDNVTFTSNSTFTNDCNIGSNLTYDWNFGAGATPPTAQTIVNSATALNDHTVYDAGGNVSESASYSTSGLKSVSVTITDAVGDCNNSPQVANLNINVIAGGIPTLSEWGLILLALLLMNLGTVAIAQEKMTLATSRNYSLPFTRLSMPFSGTHFSKAILFTAICAFVGFAASIFLTGTIAASDLIGVFVTAPVFAYLVHLLGLLKK